MQVSIYHPILSKMEAAIRHHLHKPAADAIDWVYAGTRQQQHLRRRIMKEEKS